VDDRARLERRYRDTDEFGRVGWALRMAGRNARWVRDQGLGRLVEEHELNPVRRTLTAAEKAWWRRRHGVARGTATAVLLTGTPRSGTNMMVRGLAALPEVEVFNEGDRRAFRRYRLRPDPVVVDLVHRSRHRFVLLKPLLDSHRVAALLDLLGAPEKARALWAYRDVDARARSALTKFGSSALVVLGEVARTERSTRWQAASMTPETHATLRSFDWDRLTPADGAALMWVVRNQLFFDLGLDRRSDAMAVSYEAVVRDPEAVTRAMCAHLGVEWRPRVSARIDQRSVRVARLELDPRVRELCDAMAERLDRAASAATTRLTQRDDR
jgi:hypothetical protein